LLADVAGDTIAGFRPPIFKGFFDSIDHESVAARGERSRRIANGLPYCTLREMVESARAIGRWSPDSSAEKGTPKGSHQSPLANLFCIMRSIKWMQRHILRSLSSVMLMMGFAIVRVKPG